MTFLDYFVKNTYNIPKEGVAGKESDWLDVEEIEVPRGELWAGDASVPNREEGCIVEVQPGRHRVQIKGMDFDGDRIVSRVRVTAKRARKFVLGSVRGQAITDTATIGICDIRELEAVVGKKNMREFEKDLRTVPSGYIGINAFAYGKERFDMAFVPSGFSDGEYDVRALECGSKAVGIEIEFLPPGYKME